LRLDLAYDGTDFSGWAVQKDLRTVQGEVTRILSLLTQANVELFSAGRTDAGVHANGQVVHFDVTPRQADLLRGAERINRALPEDIRVRRLSQAPDGFDARFSALWRRYTYRICDDSTRMDPLRRRQILWHPHVLDLGAMNAAAQGLLGLHDFAAFCKPRDFGSTIRTLEQLTWHRDGDFCVMTIQAEAFCHSMVRSIVGAMIPVGDGRKPSSWPSEILAARERNVGLTVQPAYALTLEEVGYPPDDQLAQRQLVTKATRRLADACD